MADLQELEDFALEAIYEFLGPDWSLKWDNRTSIFGSCIYHKKQIRLSKTLMKSCSDDEALDTVLHECAHGLAFLKHGHRLTSTGRMKHHDVFWKLACIDTGANPKRLGPDLDSKVVSQHKAPKWKFICMECSQETAYYRKPRYASKRYSCSKCYPKGQVELFMLQKDGTYRPFKDVDK